MSYFTFRELCVAIRMQCLYQFDNATDKPRDWLWSLGYDAASATGNVWCDGYCDYSA